MNYPHYFSSPKGDNFVITEGPKGWFAVSVNKKFLGDYVKGQNTWIKSKGFNHRLAREAAGIINNLL